MSPKILYVTISGGGRQLMNVVRCCKCKERSGLVSDYSTPNTCFRHGCEHVYCFYCQWLVEGVFRTVHPIEIHDETKVS